MREFFSHLEVILTFVTSTTCISSFKKKGRQLPSNPQTRQLKNSSASLALGTVVSAWRAELSELWLARRRQLKAVSSHITRSKGHLISALSRETIINTHTTTWTQLAIFATCESPIKLTHGSTTRLEWENGKKKKKDPWKCGSLQVQESKVIKRPTWYLFWRLCLLPLFLSWGGLWFHSGVLHPGSSSHYSSKSAGYSHPHKHRSPLSPTGHPTPVPPISMINPQNHSQNSYFHNLNYYPNISPHFLPYVIM